MAHHPIAGPFIPRPLSKPEHVAAKCRPSHNEREIMPMFSGDAALSRRFMNCDSTAFPVIRSSGLSIFCGNLYHSC